MEHKEIPAKPLPIIGPILSYTRLGIRAFLALSIIIGASIVSLVLWLILLPAPGHRYVGINTRYVVYPVSKLLLQVARLKVIRPTKKHISRAILVANHWGYLDSLILMSISPCLVISNMDVRRMPVVGWLMHVMGFVFVDRSSNSSIPAALNKASDEVSKAGINMALFPEGGTGDGTHLKPFHSSFFQMAIDTGYDVQPLLIRILNINSEKITSENIDRVIFHGHKVNVVSHILQMLNNRSITISVDLLPRLNRETITNNNLSRKEICLMTETAINHRFNQYLRLSNEIPSI